MIAGIGGLLIVMADFFPNVTSKDGEIIIYFPFNHNYSPSFNGLWEEELFFWSTDFASRQALNCLVRIYEIIDIFRLMRGQYGSGNVGLHWYSVIFIWTLYIMTACISPNTPTLSISSENRFKIWWIYISLNPNKRFTWWVIGSRPTIVGPPVFMFCLS